ncbi:Cytochrome c oxidase assembly protein COX18, mitochondrial [Rhodotorula toruloides]|nr:Cytochrome c oxidase assembly protein COX18, mitochondrial [Rhodotorula toruloides]
MILQSRLATPSVRAVAPFLSARPARQLAPPACLLASRNFSLSSSTPPPVESAPSPSTPDLSSPAKPVLSDLFAPDSLPDPTFFEPLSDALLSIPSSLSLSYLAFIPIATILYRAALTLPFNVWQRRRIARFANDVLPLVKKEQARIALETRSDCRRAGKSYEEYLKEFQKRAKKEAYAIARRHNCSPRLTVLVPPLVHMPILITATLVLRDACDRAQSLLAVTPASLPSLLDLAPGSTLTTTALSNLHDLASTSFLWVPSLVLPDVTMYLPLGVGLLMLLNIEVSSQIRRQTQEAREAIENPLDAMVAQAGKPVSAAERRRMVARGARDGKPMVVRGMATVPSRPAPPPPPPPPQAVERKKPDTNKIISNALRLASLAFIPIAGMAPAAVCIYWMTSNAFTLVQNAVFRWIDRDEEKKRRMKRIMSGEAVGV